MDTFDLNDEFRAIVELVENTSSNIFITGSAGTGKSTLLKHITGNTKKSHAVLAPTGIAALNAGGQTIHSFFKFPASIITPEKIRRNTAQEQLFSSLQMLIIDEISMVRVDVLEGIDKALRINRGKDTPFGGVQMVFFGDVFQLPPVLTVNDNDYIFKNYKSHYFFDAPVLGECEYILKELTRVFRQADGQDDFKNTLNNIRLNKTTDSDMAFINARHKPGDANRADDTIHLTTRRNTARDINNQKLRALNAPEKTYTGSLTGQFAGISQVDEETMDDKIPAPYKLILKKGAKVMLVRNDKLKRWVNGTLGVVENLEDAAVSVRIENKVHKIERESWKQIEYSYNPEKNKIEENTTGEYIQFPLQLAYAVTIHKSQGMTFDKVNIDIGAGAFTHGQVYVALSRCRTIEGIQLSSPLHESDIIVDPRVVEYYLSKTDPNYSPDNFKKQKEQMFKDRLLEAIKIMEEKYDYSPGILKKMIDQIGVINTIKKLVNAKGNPGGYMILKNKGALHLSMEAIILEDEWKDLFKDSDRDSAWKRLQAFGYFDK